MTFEELREACAAVAMQVFEDIAYEASGSPAGSSANPAAIARGIAKKIRAIPLPAPVDDELARATKEPAPFDGRKTTRLSGLVNREWLDLVRADLEKVTRERDEARAEVAEYEAERGKHIHAAFNANIEVATLRAEVATLTKERDEARTELLRVRDMLDEFNDQATPESQCVLEMAQTLRTRRKERDAAERTQKQAWAEVQRLEDLDQQREAERDAAIADAEKLRAEVTGLTAALAAAQRERDEARDDIHIDVAYDLAAALSLSVVQFGATYPPGCGPAGLCPVCGEAEKVGHSSDCLLGKLLRSFSGDELKQISKRRDEISKITRDEEPQRP